MAEVFIDKALEKAYYCLYFLAVAEASVTIDKGQVNAALGKDGFSD